MKEALKVYLPLALLALIMVVVMMRFISPAPPKSITFAAGGVDGQYYALSEAYRDRLAAHGIEVEIIETAGTVENYALLMDGKADVALLQGGLAKPEMTGKVQSLGGMFAEPYWIFVRAGSDVQSFGDLRDNQVAAGGAGSGTRALTLQVQGDWGGVWRDPEPISGAAAAAALLSGTVDAAVFAASVEADYVEALLGDPRVRVVPIKRAEGLSMR